MKITSLIEATKPKVPASKPRNFVAKNAISSGAGAHKDKKKAAKQGDSKHKKKEIAEASFQQIVNKVGDTLANALPKDMRPFDNETAAKNSQAQKPTKEALTPLNDVQKLQQDIAELFKMRAGTGLTWDMLDELGITKDKWEDPEMLTLLLKRINSWAHNPQTEESVEEDSIGSDSEPNQGNTPDTITVDVPLLIRLFEYAREDAKTDMDLHDVAERLIAMSTEGQTLTMQDYDEICPSSDVEESREYDDETGMASNQLQTIQRCAREMEANLVDGENLPEWVQSKITIAKENVVTAFDYILSQHQNGEIEEAMYRRPGSPSAYDRDHASSVSNMDKKDSIAYQQDGGANDEGWDKEPYQAPQDKPVLQGYYFYDVPAGKEQEAATYGIKQTKSGKWAKAKYSTSGRSYGMQKDMADKAFGPGKWWAPK